MLSQNSSGLSYNILLWPLCLAQRLKISMKTGDRTQAAQSPGAALSTPASQREALFRSRDNCGQRGAPPCWELCATLSPGRKTALDQTKRCSFCALASPLLFLSGLRHPLRSSGCSFLHKSPALNPAAAPLQPQPSFLMPWLILRVNKSHLPSKHILLRGPPRPGALSPESHPLERSFASLDDCIDTWAPLFWLQENSTAWSLPSARTCGLSLPVELPMLPHKWKMFRLMISYC